jgi:hypothetical protein
MNRIFGFLFLLNSILWHQTLAQQNWRTLGSYPEGVKTSLAGMSDSILFTGTLNGIWRAGNFGSDWKRTLISSVIYGIHVTRSGKILAGGVGKVFYSMDKGMTWDSTAVDTEFPVKQFAETTHGEFLFITGVSDSRGYVGDGVFFNNGDLKQWEKRNNGLPSSIRYCESIAIDRTGRIYLGTWDSHVTGAGGLFVSDDIGMQWHHIALKIENLGSTRIENLWSISITPDDSVIVSSNGAVTNFGYWLNVIKHRDDVMKPSAWKALRVWNTSTWWQDQLLNKIHFSDKGEWYSSVSNTRQQGGSYISRDKGKTWTRNNSGLARAITDRYEQQFFYESSDGRIAMAQFLERQIYVNGDPAFEYAVSGKIKDTKGKPIASVAVHGLGAIVLSDVNGNFTLRLPENSAGSLSFSKTDYVFSPGHVAVDKLKSDIVNIEVLASYTGAYTVKGNIKALSGLPLAEIILEGLPLSVKTNQEGDFSVQIPAGWSGSIVPVSDDYQFTPAQIQIQNLDEDNLLLQFHASVITAVSDENPFHIEVYPNPSVNGSFTLSIRDSGDFRISIWTSNGLLVHQRRIYSEGIWTEKLEIPTPGIYLLKLQTNNACFYYRIVSH